MRFLFLLNIGFDRPGPSVHLLRGVIKSSLERGHETHVILMDTQGDLPAFPEEFDRYPNLHVNYVEEPVGKKSGFIVRYFNEIRYALKCRKIFMKKGSFDGVFLQSCNTAAFYLAALKALRCPVLFNVQDIFPYNLKLSGQLPVEKLSFGILRKLQNMAYQRSTRIITISDDMKQTLTEDGVAPDKIHVVYNWSYGDLPITHETIAPENRKEIMSGNGMFNVVYAGNIGKMQNVQIIAQAARLAESHQDIRFYIIGDGVNKSHIAEQTAGLENVKMLPMQLPRFAESIYAQASVNIIPLTKGGIYTALPSKTATCLRTEVPIIFCIDQDSRFGQIASGYDTVRVASCDHPEELLEKILEIKTMGSSAKTSNYDFFREYFSENNSGKYIDIMEAMLKTKQ